jgi:hypothetical protein
MVHNNMMYFIIKERHYSNIDNSYDIVASSTDVDVIKIQPAPFINLASPRFNKTL